MECPKCHKRKPLKELSFDDKINKIQRYWPKGITDKILSQRGKIEGERKQVTVLFCDMVGLPNFPRGLAAADAFFILRYLGFPDVRVHDEAWVNWS